MRILLTVASFLPEHGGPARSVSKLGFALSKLGFHVGLWAPDASVSRLCDTNDLECLTGGFEEALCEFGDPDLIHDNGIWLPFNAKIAKICRKRAIPRIVSTRGMLEPWARNYRRFKKDVAWMLYQRRDLVTADALHATAEHEYNSLKGLQLQTPIFVAPNGVEVPDGESRTIKNNSDRTRVVLFMSRLHPVKGLPMLLKAWEILQPSGWLLKIVGPSEGGHETELRRMIAEFSIADSVKLVGPLYGEDKKKAFEDASLFVLPSYTENFGIAVAEAMANGLPVLTTTGTPWRVLPEIEAGWCVAPELEQIGNALRQAVALPSETLNEMGMRGRSYVDKRLAWDRIATQFGEEIYPKVARK